MSPHSSRRQNNFFRSLRYAVRGLGFGMQREKNIRWQLLLLVLAVVVGWYVQISATEWLAVVMVSGLVLGLEFLNTALEYIEDVLHPEFHEAIKHSKDLAAAGVLIGGMTAVVAALFIFGPHLLRLVG